MRQATAFVRNGQTTASLVMIGKEDIDHDQLLIFFSTCQVVFKVEMTHRGLQCERGARGSAINIH